jgi:PPK2 family polyphosphate:nucleotide phosphotransferase
VPADGELVIFNRSHYEDVLVVRVHGLVPEERWRRRYGHIRHFEQMLADEGTTIVKVFLHISCDEQRERLQARLDDPTKHWKFDPADLAERARWDDYQQAYADALSETSTDDAPWYVIPADHKWFRDLIVARIMVDTLDRLGLAYPESVELRGVVVE